MATREAKRAKLSALVADVYVQIDEWVATDIPAIAAEIDAITAVAVNARTDAQKVDLRALRRDLKIVRFAVKIGRVVLLVAGQARDADLGSDG